MADSRQAFSIQEEISQLFESDIKLLLEEILDEYGDPHLVIKLDRVEVDLGQLSKQNWREEFLLLFKQQFIHQLKINVGKGVQKNRKTIIHDRHEHVLNALIFFLEKGYLPWWAEIGSHKQWEDQLVIAIQHGNGAVSELISVLQQATCVDRMVFQFHDELLYEVFNLINITKYPDLPIWTKELLGSLALILSPNISLNHIRGVLFTSLLQKGITSPATFSLKTLMQAVWNKFKLSPGLLEQLQKQGPLSQQRYHEKMHPTVRQALSVLQQLVQNVSHQVRQEMRLENDSVSDELERSDAKRKFVEAEEDEKEIVEAVDVNDYPKNRQLEKDQQEIPQKEEGRIDAHTFPEQANDDIAAKEMADKVDSVPNFDINKAEKQDLDNRLRIPWRKKDETKEGEVLYIDHAGLVLLNPFFVRYFQLLELVNEGQFVNQEAQVLGVYLLYYIAAGTTRPPEYELVLPKILCQYPIDQPIEKPVDIEEEALMKGEKMMEAALRHWGALQNASPDALREGFLQRAGKLRRVDNGWNLLVEKDTLDILLTRLPFGWGLSMVKLPWMEEMLTVEWI